MKRFLQQLKTMSFIEKIQYIGFYYKNTIIISIIFLILIAITIDWNKQDKQTLLSIVLFLENADTHELGAFNQRLNNDLIPVSKQEKYEVKVEEIYYSSDVMNRSANVGLQKLIVKMVAEEIDVLISDKDLQKDLMEKKELMPIDNFLPDNTLSKIKDQLIYSQDNVMGIEIQASINMPPSFKNKVISIPNNAQHLEIIDDFLNVFLKEGD